MENSVLLNELIESNRIEQLKAIMRFIDKCGPTELALIIEEIRCCHNNIFVFNTKTKSLDKVEQICLNGECIQINVRKIKN